MIRSAIVTVIAASAVHSGASRLQADLIGGVDFPGGIASFADAVVSYNPILVSGNPKAPYDVPANAVGAPDYPGSGITYVTLGDGGSLVLRFTDNSLTGNGTSGNDLWIFEVGPDVEDTFVAISTDGVDWSEVGKVTGGTRGIDIDAYGYGPGQYVSYVRLIDDTREGEQSGVTVGADIDAVGAISSAPPVDPNPQPVPEPATVLLVAGGLAAVILARRKGR